MDIEMVLSSSVVRSIVHMKGPALGFIFNGKMNILSVRQSLSF